jgi:hypothetical protein
MGTMARPADPGSAMIGGVLWHSMANMPCSPASRANIPCAPGDRCHAQNAASSIPPPTHLFALSSAAERVYAIMQDLMAAAVIKREWDAGLIAQDQLAAG